MQIEGVAAIVSGGGTGLGAATAEMLASRGVKVTILGRREDVIKRKASEIGCLGISCDVADECAIDTAVAQAEDAHGVASILINAAGVGRIATTLTPSADIYPRQELRDIIEINLFGTLFLGQAFASSLAKSAAQPDSERGVIINVSSIASEDGIIGPAYAASKGGVNGMCLSLAREYGPWGIRVVTIVPGTFDTEAWEKGGSPEAEQYTLQAQAFPHRLGRAEEFASLTLHVCENQFLNGCCIRQDAGQRIPYFSDLAKNA